MITKTDSITATGTSTHSHVFTNLKINPFGTSLFISIDVTGVSSSTSSKTIYSRLHSSMPWVSLATPAAATATTMNALSIFGPDIKVDIASTPGAGVSQTTTVTVFN
jgi:hypothetical protein